MFNWFKNKEQQEEIDKLKSKLNCIQNELTQHKEQAKYKEYKESIVTEIDSITNYRYIDRQSVFNTGLFTKPEYKFIKFKNGDIEIRINGETRDYTLILAKEDAKLLSMLIEEENA